MVLRFAPEIVEEGKLKFVHSPHYIFKKKGAKEILGGDYAHECPEGYHSKVIKGLGGLSDSEVKHFITNPETRDLWTIELEDKKKDFATIDSTLGDGGKKYIVGEN